MLISTIVIYNTKGYIDDKTIAALQGVVGCVEGKERYFKSERDIPEQLSAVMPRFVWVLRDFEAPMNP